MKILLVDKESVISCRIIAQRLENLEREQKEDNYNLWDLKNELGEIVTDLNNLYADLFMVWRKS